MPRTALILFILPIVALAAATVFIRVYDLDLAWSASFYDSVSANWSHGDDQPWSALYEYGFIPAWIVAIGGGAVFVAAFFSERLRRYRTAGLFLILVMVIGPGILVNAVFKDHWGRPRPREVQAFGGSQPFEEVLTIDPASDGKSFPSGHASMGFYFMSLGFVFYRFAKKALAWFAGIAGFAFGCLMGAGRVIQGGHFPSDVLWSAGFVFLTAAALYLALGMHKNAPGDSMRI